MPIEWGRFTRIKRDDRIFELCSLHRSDNECNYVLECTYFEDLRGLYLPSDLITRLITVIENLMSSFDNDMQLLFKGAKYCKVVLKTFQEIFRNSQVLRFTFSYGHCHKMVWQSNIMGLFH